MREYVKIETLFNRSEDGSKKLSIIRRKNRTCVNPRASYE